ncbi:MAG: sugar transferase [Ruminococcaceae bacterium]|nr:sugar transferase [Oscillospiraceae bacterium]
MNKMTEINTVSALKKKSGYLVFKGIMDIFLSIVAVLALSPVLLVFSIVIFLTDFHNPFYLQERIGKGGRAFKIIKFRSMYYDAEDLDKYFTGEQKEKFIAEYKIEDDPRITPVGKFIRKFSIDELPQLFNVAFGQMSLVGPRPLTLEETYFFGDERETLLSVKPGITGLWQVSGRNALTYESGERQKCEIRYVNNFGFKMDVAVFLKTFKAVFGGSGI